MDFFNSIRFLKRKICTLLTFQMIAPIIIQPLIIVFVTTVLPDNMFIICLTLAIILGTPIHLTKNELRSNFLYYWTVSSTTYIIIIFEFLIVPMAEILASENFFLVLFTVLSLSFLYLTKTNIGKSLSNGYLGRRSDNEILLGENEANSLCPACRIKMEPGNYHCNICQECIPLYDHHSYWLNCCISDQNIHLYFVGIFFGVFALIHGSLLILTTICSPDFYFGILLPENCSEVCSNVETCACLVSGIYCMELASVLALKVLHHFWLISRGVSMFEWREKLGGHSLKVNSFWKEFVRNWTRFFHKFKKIHLEL